MTEKELKKLNRYQLLELLILQTERAEELQKQLDELKAELESRRIELTRMGSIAEASLHLGGVFEAAQCAADLYINAAKERAAALEAEARQQAAGILAEAARKAAEENEKPSA